MTVTGKGKRRLDSKILNDLKIVLRNVVPKNTSEVEFEQSWAKFHSSPCHLCKHLGGTGCSIQLKR